MEPLRGDVVEKHAVLARGAVVRCEDPARDPVHGAPALLDRGVQVEANVLGEARIGGDPEEPALPLLRDGDGGHGRRL